MNTVRPISVYADEHKPRREPALTYAIRQEQLDNICQSTPHTTLLNYLVGICALAAALYSQNTLNGLWWFALCVLVNMARMSWYKSAHAHINSLVGVQRHLTICWRLTLGSGVVWALIAFCSSGYSSELSMVFLIMVCAITGATVALMQSHSLLAITFVTPPLLTAVACMVLIEATPTRLWLALAIFTYWIALVGTALRCQQVFLQSARDKHEASHLALSLHDTLEHLRNSSTTLIQQAHQDSLTGLSNRHGFMQTFSGTLEPRKKGFLCLMLLDLDGFKSVNDCYGHSAGDSALAAVGNWLKEQIAGLFNASKERVGCGRLGGDEFVVFCEVESPQQANSVANNLILSFTNNVNSSHAHHLGISIGMRLASEPTTLSDLLLGADEAMQAAKQAGRNRVQLYDEALQQALNVKRDIGRDMMIAIDNKQIELHFQPIVGSLGRRIDSFEGLLRWKHPSHGWINPETIVLIAAHNGCAGELTRHIIDMACEGLLQFSRHHSNEVRVAINLSPREILQLPVDEIVIDALKRHKLQADRLEIEITEDTALDMDATRAKLERLAAAGVDVAVDDFGIGYSSLGLIRSRFVKRIKIDRSFSADIHRRHDSRAVIAAAVGLGRSLNLRVVAEGIESRDQFELLAELGCDLFQGYYFSRAMPLSKALTWLEKNN